MCGFKFQPNWKRLEIGDDPRKYRFNNYTILTILEPTNQLIINLYPSDLMSCVTWSELIPCLAWGVCRTAESDHGQFLGFSVLRSAVGIAKEFSQHLWELQSMLIPQCWRYLKIFKAIKCRRAVCSQIFRFGILRFFKRQKAPHCWAEQHSVRQVDHLLCRVVVLGVWWPLESSASSNPQKNTVERTCTTMLFWFDLSMFSLGVI